MAGAGRRTFQPGEVLTASNVNSYLMDQSVMRFADSAARGSAIGTAVVAEGMVSYLQDTGSVEVYQTVGTAYATWQPVNMSISDNYIINGGFDIWQRGTATVTTNGSYSADRFIIGSSAGTNAVTRSTDVPDGVGLQYSLSFAGTSTTNPLIRQRIESLNAVQFAGKTVTLSFYAKSTNGAAPIKVNTAFPTTTVDTFGTWASPTTTADNSALAVTPSGNAASGWTRYQVTFDVSANADRGYQIDLYRESTTTSTTTLYSGVQLEVGVVATPFRRFGGLINAELSACRRYFQSGVPGGAGRVTGATLAQLTVSFTDLMRTGPIITQVNTWQILYAGIAFYTVTAVASSSGNPRGAILDVTSSGMTVGAIVTTVGIDQGLWFSAEL